MALNQGTPARSLDRKSSQTCNLPNPRLAEPRLIEILIRSSSLNPGTEIPSRIHHEHVCIDLQCD